MGWASFRHAIVWFVGQAGSRGVLVLPSRIARIFERETRVRWCGIVIPCVGDSPRARANRLRRGRDVYGGEFLSFERRGLVPARDSGFGSGQRGRARGGFASMCTKGLSCGWICWMRSSCMATSFRLEKFLATQCCEVFTACVNKWVGPGGRRK